MTKQKQVWMSELGLILTTILWGGAFAAVKSAAQVSPFWQVGLRFTIGACILAAVFHRHLHHWNRAVLQSGFLLGCFLFFAYLLATIGLQYTTAGKNAFLTAVYVVLVPFVYWGIHRTRPSGSQLFAALLCLLGIGLLSLNGDRFSLGIGELLTLAAGGLYACHIAYLGIASQKQDAIQLSIVQLAVCGGWGLLLAIPSGPLPPLTHISLLSILYLAVFGTAATMVLQTVCQKYVEPSRASLLMSLESVFGCLAGILLLGERLTPQTAGGFVLIFLSILFADARPRTKLPADAQDSVTL